MDFKEAQNSIDIKENYIMYLDDRLLRVLLKDKSSDGNIIWATDMYAWRGSGFHERDEMTLQAITGRRGNVIKPRIEKSKKEQKERIKKKGEVFTPSWSCNLMASGFDVWFERENVFNVPDGETWHKTQEPITFPEGKTWRDYVRMKVLEITCGEAPFLASRYDTVTGKWIDVNSRVGLLDRKLRVINENVSDEDDWIKYAFEAYQSTYGFEWQGDSLLIARENLLFTFIDYYADKFDKFPAKDILLSLANVIAWNIFQMDGLKFVVPYSCEPKIGEQLSLFDEEQSSRESCLGCLSGDNSKHIGIYSIIKNWRAKTTCRFYDLSGGNKMKFDFIIGNPPYQGDVEESENKTFMPSVYNLFMDMAYELSDRVELVHPARFLFNAGQTPKTWNQKMLSDPNLKILYFEPDSSKIFPNTDIKGGVVISYHDKTKNFGAIQTFTSFPELNSILIKVNSNNDNGSLMNIVYAQNRFNLENLYFKYPQYKSIIGSDGRDKRFRNNIFEKIPLFTDEKVNEDDLHVLGITNNKRVWKYFPIEFVDLEHENLLKWKVMVPSANGSGAIGEVMSTPLCGTPLCGTPLCGYTQSFIGIGAFETESEANNCLKYIKSKFARTMLGILKITQHNAAPTWRYVPLQDFTSSSDIDWKQSVAEIDVQLYKKYGLDENEISFIESHVKEMN